MTSLLATRGLEQPDGRPLYAYRFSRTDIESCGAIVRRHGSSALRDRSGAALVICHIAEWFRRERGGGHWDWIRPLRTLGLEYGTYASVQYRDVEALVSLGLRVWRRPEPTGGERLLAIVREAGFPVASVREDPRIASWLKNSVLCAERGFATRDAVGAEAWRVSERLAQALFDPAVDLCDKIVELRRLLPPGDAGGDPVEFLDGCRPGWRDELPFDVECDDIRGLVERIVRTREDGSAALDVTRRLVLARDGWQARATLGLSGNIDLRRLPNSVAAAVRDGRRLRVFPCSPYCDEMVAVAAIETFDQDDGPIHELRAFVARFDAALALKDEARLLVQAGTTTISQFVAAGGEALKDPVVALDIEQLDEEGRPVSLRVLGPSPVQTTRSRLALAVKRQYFEAVSFSAGFEDLGAVIGSDRRLVAFSGRARFRLDDTTWSWRTSAESTVDARLVLIGDLLRGVRESVFRGVPTCWIERDGHLMAPRRTNMRWRPKGRGTWQSIEDARPWGNVDLAIIENGELRLTVGAAIVPPDFEVSIDPVRRQLRVEGLRTRLLSAGASGNLTVAFDRDAAIVTLGPPSGVATIVLRPRWDAELAITVSDPSYDLCLVDSSDRPMSPRSILSLDALKGVRIRSTRDVSLTLELRAIDAPRLAVVRTISGEVPLSTFADTIHQLLGSSESLDARIAVGAIGAGQQIAEVRWYAEDVDPFDAPRPNAFSVLATTHGLELKAFSLAHPSAGTVAVSAPASQATMRAELSKALPAGPWLVYGHRRNGARIRPRIVPAAPRSFQDEQTLLERAIGTDASAARAVAFVRAYAQADQLSSLDRRTIVTLLTVARREGLPISSIDAIKALDGSPALATLLLASCDSLDERAALLDLQRDLPFLWSSTTISNWLEAFAARIADTRRRLADAGIDDTITYRSILLALREIVALRPELAGHARAVFLVLVTAEMARAGRTIESSEGNFLKVPVGHGTRSEIDRLIARHDDTDIPPRGLLSPRALMAQQRHFEPYDERFAETIATPLAIADHAAGRMDLSVQEIRRCRDVWLFDPEYFETMVPVGIEKRLREATTMGQGRA
ncbi:STY4851/ECs_5259 family protein [Ancylobacter oerskovii]|uniref:STY4851/ECs_5259 family protein n=1 Tax=Ancylobacter oerskovii TaxID=459519 RepID=A0ABW4Z014_9HYPH|nr:STY4851/ECs_5259 family protein [Ancylobacter oerskovii]MBS7542854.1 STY4851/ECs_5259 family protein [Ancylobacter oerskovii]